MPKVRLGIDVFMEDPSFVAGKRVGLLTNQTGADSKLTSTIRLFHREPGINLCALFAPEHGIKTVAREGEKFSDTVHAETNIPVFSLYGNTKKPTKEMLETVDIVIFDLQDIGARYYTYIYSMLYMMEACAEYQKEMVVLDRPNPIGGTEVEGNLVEQDYTSFVGLYPLPSRHGMTVGELALLFNDQIGCQLKVVKMEGWNRNMLLPHTGLPWIPPSPNTTSLDMMLLYPGTCLLEGTNLSEGRGTVQPFEIFGAPFIDGSILQDAVNSLKLPGLHARETSFKPTYSKFKDEVCEGIQLHVTDRMAVKPVEAFVHILRTVFRLYGDRITFLEYEKLRHPMFDLLAGNEVLRHSLTGCTDRDYLEDCRKGSVQFLNGRTSYLLYR
ncbi:exo-beta-N-acetylmuramidase NamZ domain-containing protein [Chungangia koreensis]|uniref:Exo-beta-N-acetylmuramidase NamZ domain-containing protein n=1 Tax=Chungangia koreensis TaxID=752657 RepID=A0ABV8X1A4_9LACT